MTADAQEMPWNTRDWIRTYWREFLSDASKADVRDTPPLPGFMSINDYQVYTAQIAREIARPIPDERRREAVDLGVLKKRVLNDLGIGAPRSIEVADAVINYLHSHGWPRGGGKPNEAERMLKYLEDECYDLRCVDEPIADTGDSDVFWQVISHHMSEPRERLEGVGNKPASAILSAMSGELHKEFVEPSTGEAG